ncbi:endonuclease III [Aerococcus sanguinicola]|uniref:endonuclease III n=1 Tax=unclassified Aerococcus TaxID=2618060 RepID=UPI0008A614E3|nr:MULTISPECIES: endonuclease III [unclassified Aerococcus]MDK6234002.1 endonuclease III [Aerococcus sp. UMB10185]MDK6804844.1 endonuclease III [Aerococcus sp. UMB7834]MDK6856528.1 endonuclease III [Aerococcus sp. UMB7533]MDK8502042.1 endonuclease III [Aerococcus sp. UMB1112A]OFN03419.1 endonuclease III [Aerococcus sp. HMSC062A02]
MLSDQCARQVIEAIMALYPHTQSALNFENPYQLLIAAMLSAQTTDAKVNELTPALFAAFPEPKDLAQASQEEVIPYIKPLGLYNNRSKYMIKCAQKLLEDFDGQVPQSQKELETLPGIGRKCANVVLSNAYQVPAFAVDTHVIRICKRHEIVAPSASTLEIEERVTQLLPEEDWLHAHQAMGAMGREICTPKHPTCHDIPELWPCPDQTPNH